MSAYVVNKTHIDYLVNAAITCNRTNRAYITFGQERELVERDEADNIGRALWATNVASVMYRYNEPGMDNLPGPCNFDHEALATYRFAIPRETQFDTVTALSALACYEYQSCEHEGWPQTPAYQFCQQLRYALISRLPGYDKAPWEIADESREEVAA